MKDGSAVSVLELIERRRLMLACLRLHKRVVEVKEDPREYYEVGSLDRYLQG